MAKYGYKGELTDELMRDYIYVLHSTIKTLTIYRTYFTLGSRFTNADMLYHFTAHMIYFCNSNVKVLR